MVAASNVATVNDAVAIAATAIVAAKTPAVASRSAVQKSPALPQLRLADVARKQLTNR
jgi:hypothetical protein